MSGSDTVRQMNRHLGTALKLIEQSAADNNAQIREEMKQFFSKAEQIMKDIATLEVKDMNTVKKRELDAIEEQKQQVAAFMRDFDMKIGEIESQMRDVLHYNSKLLDC